MYHVFKEPLVDDEFYDGVKLTYVHMCRDNPELAQATPKARTIAEQIATNHHEARHDFPMLELRETNDLHGLRRWFELVEADSIVVEPYLAGCEVELVYVGGNLHKAVNRGDGLIGKDITLDMYSVRGVPQTIPELERVNIHGKVVISKRNIGLTAGFEHCHPVMVVAHHLMKSYPGVIAASEPDILQFIPHTVNIPGVTFDLMELRGILIAWDFNIPQARVFSGNCREIGALEEGIEEYVKQNLEDPEYDYLGLMFRVNETQKRLELGYTSRYPEWAINYKGKLNGSFQSKA